MTSRPASGWRAASSIPANTPSLRSRSSSAPAPSFPSVPPCVYPGADGRFTLYEDAGDGYGYEAGEYTTIDLTWHDATGTLTIGPRHGSYPGMLGERDFTVTLPGHAPVTVHYTGKEVEVQP